MALSVSFKSDVMDIIMDTARKHKCTATEAIEIIVLNSKSTSETTYVSDKGKDKIRS